MPYAMALEALKYGGGAVAFAGVFAGGIKYALDSIYRREFETIIVYQARIIRLNGRSCIFERNEVLSGRLPDIVRGTRVRNLMQAAAKSCKAGKDVPIVARFMTYAHDDDAATVGDAVAVALKSTLWRNGYLAEADGLPTKSTQKLFIIGGSDTPINRRKQIRVTLVNQEDIDILNDASIAWDTKGEMDRIGLESAKALAEAHAGMKMNFRQIGGMWHRLVYPVRAVMPLSA